VKITKPIEHSSVWQKAQSIINKLISPQNDIPKTSSDYNHTRVVNIALLCMVIMGLFSIYPTDTNLPNTLSPLVRFIIASAIGIISVICYIISRRRFWHLAIRLQIYSLILIITSLAINPHLNSIIELTYLLFVVIWALFFIGWREWLGIMTLNLAMILVFAWLTSTMQLIDILRGIFLLHLFANALLIVGRLYLERTYQNYTHSLEIASTQLRLTVESDLDGIYLMNAVRNSQGEIIDFRLVEVNSEACWQLNMTRDQLIGGLICELFPINRTNGFFDQYKQVAETGIMLSQEYNIPDDHIHAGWYQHQVVCVNQNEGNLVIHNRDITQNKHYELNLFKQHNQLQSLMESQTSYLIRTDIYGNYIYANQWFINHFEMIESKIIGETALSTIYEEDWGKVYATVEKCMENPGRPVPVTFRKPHRDGRLLWTDWEFIAIQDDAGNIIEIQSVGLDATARVDAEEAHIKTTALEIELEKQAELNEIKTRMMTRISHEFRTPLSIIRSSTSLLERYMNRMDETKRAEKISNIYAEIDHLSGMLSDMGRFLQGGQQSALFISTPTNLPETVLKLITRYEQDFIAPTQQRIQFIASPNFPLVTIDPNEFDLILNNLVSNAMKYSPQNAPITIRLAYTTQTFTLSVTDEGVGILPNEQDKIFDSFYRGSNFGEVGGMGIGLSLVKNAVELHGGNIVVTSNDGKGTTFTVTLPITP